MPAPYSSAPGNRPPPVVSGPYGKGRTKQALAKEADINVIMARYDKTGVIPVSKRQGFYADVSTMGDYRAVMERVQEAAEFFWQQPAELRAEFKNDPALFLDYVSNASEDDLREKGLLEAEGENPPAEEVAAPPVETPEIPASE